MAVNLCGVIFIKYLPLSTHSNLSCMMYDESMTHTTMLFFV